MAIGAALVYPSIAVIMGGEPLYTLFAGTIFESPVYVTFLGIPVILMNYASSVIPVVLVCFFAAKLERFLDRCIPQLVEGICRTNAYNFGRCCSGTSGIGDRLQHSQVICWEL